MLFVITVTMQHSMVGKKNYYGWFPMFIYILLYEVLRYLIYLTLAVI